MEQRYSWTHNTPPLSPTRKGSKDVSVGQWQHHSCTQKSLAQGPFQFCAWSAKTGSCSFCKSPFPFFISKYIYYACRWFCSQKLLIQFHPTKETQCCLELILWRTKRMHWRLMLLQKHGAMKTCLRINSRRKRNLRTKKTWTMEWKASLLAARNGTLKWIHWRLNRVFIILF